MTFAEYGGPELLALMERPQPSPGPGQLLIQVCASSVNPADWRIRSGQFKRGLRLRLPFVPGNDLSGRVIQTGAGVADFRVGEHVFAMTPLKFGGGCAEFAAVDAKYAAQAPSALTLEDAAAIPLAGLTALQGLRDHGRLRAGQRLLVVGASGGVGHFGVQIGKALGAHVTGLCGARSFEFVRGLGADEVLDYTDPDSHTGPGRYDLVFDTIATAPFTRWRHVLAPGATVVTVKPVIGRLVPDVVARLFGVAHLRSVFVQSRAADLRQLARYVDDGQLKPTIEARFPLADLAAAHRLSAQGHVRGKLVITVSDHTTESP
jgi:NADPH:quinone reductase-like Zn-dependent oxidoreductase